MSKSNRGQTSVAERLEWLRHYFGKSQKDFAESLHVLPTTYNNWLRPRQGLSLYGARLIKERYHVTLDFLFFGDAEGLPEEIRAAWEFRPKPSNDSNVESIHQDNEYIGNYYDKRTRCDR